jgi:hypothetical protein
MIPPITVDYPTLLWNLFLATAGGAVIFYLIRLILGVIAENRILAQRWLGLMEQLVTLQRETNELLRELTVPRRE